MDYDVVIVGAGISGALIAKRLGAAGKKVLILEAGMDGQGSYADDLERFYLAQAKVPESPYTPPIVTADAGGYQAPSNPSAQAVGRPSTLTIGGNWQDPSQAYLDQQGPLAFASTYERVGGGTMRHWLGTSLRFVPHDFEMKTVYNVEEDWPISYDDLEPWYGEAESEIGVAADVANQDYLGITFPPDYQYPMPPIPSSLVDQAVTAAMPKVAPIEGVQLEVTNTPAGRNSIPYQDRRVCAGNTNCIPICPIQAKYDASVTLGAALQFPGVTIMYQTVASEIVVDESQQVTAINYLQYTDQNGPATGSGSVSATRYVIAGHAIETPKLLLMSKNGGLTPYGVANTSSRKVGLHLMDHPIYLCWALTQDPLYGYRGPLSTAGIESMRDGAFRNKHAAFRIEIGNEGWNFPIGDPYTTTLDFIVGADVSGLNEGSKSEFGSSLTGSLNHALTRQFRLGFLMEQSPEDYSYVTLSETYKDSLNLPRPQIHYNLSHYTKMGFVVAKRTGSQVYAAMGATEYTTEYTAEDMKTDPTVFDVTYDAEGNPAEPGTPGSTTEYFKFFGAGHVVGTYRMGIDRSCSVVDREQRSWDHTNLFLVGSGVFPTVATGNPTLTIAALALWASDTLLADLG